MANGFTGNVISTMIELLVAGALISGGLLSYYTNPTNVTGVAAIVIGLVPLAVGVGIMYHAFKSFGIKV